MVIKTKEQGNSISTCYTTARQYSSSGSLALILPKYDRMEPSCSTCTQRVRIERLKNTQQKMQQPRSSCWAYRSIIVCILLRIYYYYLNNVYTTKKILLFLFSTGTMHDTQAKLPYCQGIPGIVLLPFIVCQTTV